MNRTYVPYEDRAEHVHYKGSWISGTAYNYGDEVANDGAMFVCILAHTATSGLEPIPVADEVIVGPAGAKGDTGNTGLQGPKGDPGTAASNWSSEEPSGTKNGANKTFTLAHTPAGNILLFYGGQALREGATEDFTVSDVTITLINIAPESDERLMAYYAY